MDTHEPEQTIDSPRDRHLDDELGSEDKEEIYGRALRRARMRMALYIHAVAFVAGILLLVLINLLTTPRTLWVVWPLFGWGVGLFLHWFLATRLVGMYENIKEQEIARQLEQRKPQ